MNDYSLTPREKRKVNKLKKDFHKKVDLYYSLPWNHKDRAKVYDEAVKLLDKRLYIILGV